MYGVDFAVVDGFGVTFGASIEAFDAAETAIADETADIADDADDTAEWAMTEATVSFAGTIADNADSFALATAEEASDFAIDASDLAADAMLVAFATTEEASDLTADTEGAAKDDTVAGAEATDFIAETGISEAIAEKAACVDTATIGTGVATLGDDFRFAGSPSLPSGRPAARAGPTRQRP